ncbi:DNA-binding protein [Hydrogenophaga sp.]|uniref:DNA-binding protein n=1 Tax=Hydrogenophaga sp. TaxID=1904254 RepID=UPI00391A9429
MSINLTTPEYAPKPHEVPPRRLRRPPVTVEAVSHALDELSREGRPQTIENIVARVGGSKSTVLRHLESLRGGSQPSAQEEPLGISPQVLRAITSDVGRLVKERTVELEGLLSEAQSALKVLTKECEELQASELETDELVEILRTALSEQTGANRALQDELRSKDEQLVASRSSAEDARRALAVCEANLRASEERLQSVADEGDQLRLEAEVARQRIANLEAERASLLERLAEARQALSHSEGDTRQLIEKLLASGSQAHDSKKKS